MVKPTTGAYTYLFAMFGVGAPVNPKEVIWMLNTGTLPAQGNRYGNHGGYMTKVVFKVIAIVAVACLAVVGTLACDNAMPDTTTTTKAQQVAAQAAAEEDRKRQIERKRKADLAKASTAFRDECWSLGGWPQGGLLIYTGMEFADRQAGITCSFDHRLTHNLINEVESTNRFTHADAAAATKALCAPGAAILPRRISPITGYCYVIVR